MDLGPRNEREAGLRGKRVGGVGIVPSKGPALQVRSLALLLVSRGVLKGGGHSPDWLFPTCGVGMITMPSLYRQLIASTGQPMTGVRSI